MANKKYDSTVARIAGNIAGGLDNSVVRDPVEAARDCVALARAIVAEVQFTSVQDYAELRALAGAMRKLLPPSLLQEVVSYLAPVEPFVAFLQGQDKL